MDREKMRDYQRGRRQQRRAAGLRQVTVEVPAESAERFRALAAQARDGRLQLAREHDRRRAKQAIAAGRRWRQCAKRYQERNDRLVERIMQPGWRGTLARWLLGIG